MSQAIRTSDFTGALGVNTHLYVTTSQYWDGGTVLADLKYIGISQVRDAVVSATNTGQASYAQLADAGIKFDFLFTSTTAISSGLSQVDSFISAHSGSVVAIEGVNEINFTPMLYSSLSGTSAAVSYQADLFTAVHGDTLLNGIPVFNFTDTTSGVAGLADYANTHSYAAHGAEPYAQLLADLKTQQAAMTGKSVVLTEAGYSTLPTAGGLGGVDYATQAKLTLNLIMDATKLGYKEIYLYQLLDSTDPTNSDIQAHFGLFDASGAAKPAAVALHNLTSILADTGSTASTFTTGSLNYSLTNMPSTASSLLLEKSSGAYDLVLWNEPQIWNSTTNTAVTAATSTVTVNLGGTYATVDVYDPLTGTTAVVEAHNVSQITVSISDHPLIIEVSQASTAATIVNNPLTVTGAHVLSGGAGNDYLSDAVANGAAITMAGGAGNDAYVVSNSNDVIIEKPGEGTDTVLSSVSFTLPANVEVLTFTGSANVVGRANDGISTLTANSGNDTLYGGAGTSTLIGGSGQTTMIAGTGSTTFIGGTGPDTMIGGSGHAYFVVNNSNDIVQAQANGGYN
ncbi:MAG: calcium-binding protein, partial [Caulobacteraceae bacterium]|nr:calcium-binding protein [Caulobacteraceae bacterium]